MCREEDEIEEKNFRFCIGERSLVYWPQVGDAKHCEPVYIEKANFKRA